MRKGLEKGRRNSGPVIKNKYKRTTTGHIKKEVCSPVPLQKLVINYGTDTKESITVIYHQTGIVIFSYWSWLTIQIDDWWLFTLPGTHWVFLLLLHDGADMNVDLKTRAKRSLGCRSTDRDRMAIRFQLSGPLLVIKTIGPWCNTSIKRRKRTDYVFIHEPNSSSKKRKSDLLQLDRPGFLSILGSEEAVYQSLIRSTKTNIKSTIETALPRNG